MRGNSNSTYGSITKTLHWLMAAMVLSMIPLGIIASGMADAAAMKPVLFSIHKTLGVTIFFLALARIAWAISQPKPGAYHPQRTVTMYLAAVVHWLMYASLVVVPLSGWVHHAATSGFADIWWPFGQNLPFVPEDEGVAHVAASLHIIFERVLVFSFVLHFLGVLYHHYIDKDDTLRRMLPGRAQTEPPSDQPRVSMPVLGAIGVYAGALAIGAALGMFAQPERVEAAQLAQTQSEWVVQDGTLGITVRQLGSDVEGSFADWTAAINFTETPDETGKYGDVEVTIAVASLTLGSVTAQAMGPDFFGAETHQTAVFRADIFAQEPGYVATGSLSLKGVEAPLLLPFTLQIDGDTATMEGQTSVSRSAYGIGMGTQPGEGSLGYDVAVTVTLTATR